MNIIFIFCIAFVFGGILVLSTQVTQKRRKKYGFKGKIDFDYASKIDYDILDKDKDTQHSNKN